ncbi:transcriptional regulator [Undibacterium sp. SXout7W]|uniref:transcriptional regulator n=1 Tax=Undibacterium sp. SXout7W TaxID=3413049 RepID=UPI003BEFEDF5
MQLQEYLTQKNISQSSFAELLGVSQSALWQWSLSGRKVPAEHCPTIERLTERAVTCEELRPDIDWGVLRGTHDIKE